MTKITFFFLSVFMIFLIACKDKSAQNAPVTTVALNCDSIKYSRHIYPIIAKNCAVPTCHMNGFASGDFTTYGGLNAKILSGAFKIRVFESPGNSMPPQQNGGQLPQFELDSIKCWLDRGALNN